MVVWSVVSIDPLRQWSEKQTTLINETDLPGQGKSAADGRQSWPVPRRLSDISMYSTNTC
jgi:Fe-S cluster biosynthesis and repair protein YggX